MLHVFVVLCLERGSAVIVGRVFYFFCWDMQTVGAWRWTCWLADLNTTVGSVLQSVLCLSYWFGKWGAMYGVVCLGNVSGLGKCNSITGLGQ